MYIKTFDIANMIIKEADKKFGDNYSLNEEKVEIFKEYCDALDEIVNEFNCNATDISVDEESKTIVINLETDYMSIDGNEHVFYELAERSISFWFNYCNDSELQISFVFPALWD